MYMCPIIILFTPSFFQKNFTHRFISLLSRYRYFFHLCKENANVRANVYIQTSAAYDLYDLTKLVVQRHKFRTIISPSLYPP